MKKSIVFTFIACVLLFTSCERDEVGGNADISTVEFSVLQSEWFTIGDYGYPGFGFAVDLNMPEITENVIYDGMVTLYRKTYLNEGGEFWAPVPVYYYYEGFQGGFLYFMKRGQLSIEYYESDHLTENPGTQIFKLVIVQPV